MLNDGEAPNAHVRNKRGEKIARVRIDPKDGSVKITEGDLPKGLLNKLKKPLQQALKKMSRALSIVDILKLMDLLKQLEKLGPGHSLTYDPISGDFGIGSDDDPNVL